MKLNEIKEYGWDCSDYSVAANGIQSISKIEQETHMLSTEGYCTEFDVTTTEPKMINRLRHSEYFKLNHVVASSNPFNLDHVLEVQGSLEFKGLMFRKKRVVLSEEKKQIIRDRFVKNMAKKRSEVKENE